MMNRFAMLSTVDTAKTAHANTTKPRIRRVQPVSKDELVLRYRDALSYEPLIPNLPKQFPSFKKRNTVPRYRDESYHQYDDTYEHQDVVWCIEKEKHHDEYADDCSFDDNENENDDYEPEDYFNDYNDY